MQVLIVDDSILIRRCLIKLFDLIPTVTGLTEATNVPEAIRLLGEVCPQVVILDLHLPGGSGFDVLRRTQSDPHKPLVIILTNYSSQQFRKEAMDGGADYFFDKSNEYEQLLQVVRDYSGSATEDTV